MGLGKYYCDYCDKQFQDTPFARKRHLQGIQHLRAKALWFDSLNLNLNLNLNGIFTSQSTHPLVAVHACLFFLSVFIDFSDTTQPHPKGVCNRFLNTV